MKKLFLVLKSIFSGSLKSNTVSFRLEMSENLAADLERMRMNAGYSDYRQMFSCLIAHSRWALQKLDEGKIIVAMDPQNLHYNQLDVTHIFPNLKKTGAQEIDGCDEDDN